MAAASMHSAVMRFSIRAARAAGRRSSGRAFAALIRRARTSASSTSSSSASTSLPRTRPPCAGPETSTPAAPRAAFRRGSEVRPSLARRHRKPWSCACRMPASKRSGLRGMAAGGQLAAPLAGCAWPGSGASSERPAASTTATSEREGIVMKRDLPGWRCRDRFAARRRVAASAIGRARPCRAAARRGGAARPFAAARRERRPAAPGRRGRSGR